MRASSLVATEVLRRIVMLHAIEDEVRSTSTEHRCSMRAEQARLIVDDLHIYPEARLRQVSPKSKLADAIRYALT
ncbi:IS66 family transposase [Novosphingobium sp. TCA1]|uniref:IS66 family transposase n=1 Tax=Novosphingobium sp. TCA1 TaxID=2682474 RepID=UPI001F2A4154|nr:IS66 family transposase [Novosphingobium sp. TCA1]